MCVKQARWEDIAPHLEVGNAHFSVFQMLKKFMFLMMFCKTQNLVQTMYETTPHFHSDDHLKSHEEYKSKTRTKI